MCGIFGTINNPIPLDKVLPSLIHRGPDAQTTWANDRVQLHHFRLSILDHEGGKQPMQRGPLVVIFNGELYNHIDVRKQYNLTCHTNSDTETLLAAYEKLGPQCLHAFDGMFAMAIYDSRSNQIFLARDRAGKKPLYYYKEANKVVFSSELKALSQSLTLKPSLNSIDQFLKGAFMGQDTAYEGVSELLGGHYAYIDVSSGDTEISCWWSIDDHYGQPSSDDYNIAEDKIKQYITTAVQRRVESSDLEVAAFLSGGIDSGLVVAAASKIYPRLKTFTVSMPGAYDEAALAQLVADQCKTNHTTINIHFDQLQHDFASIVSNYGEPFVDSSAIPSYYVSQAAKEYVTVVLNGDGADELFAGYRRYVPTSKLDFYKNKSNALWRLLAQLLPIAHEKKSSYNYIYRLVKALSMGNAAKTYWSLTTDMFSGYEDAFVMKGSNEDYINKYVEKHSQYHPLHKQMGLDFHILLQGILLKKMDIATMAHSLEGRSPFLCKELLEYAPSIHPKYKINGSQTKVILRNIAKQWLPPEIFGQPKRGFEIPLKNWMNDQLRPFVMDYLDRPSPFVSQFVKEGFINQLIHNKVSVSAEKRAKMLYQLLVTELWAKNNRF